MLETNPSVGGSPDLSRRPAELSKIRYLLSGSHKNPGVSGGGARRPDRTVLRPAGGSTPDQILSVLPGPDPTGGRHAGVAQRTREMGVRTALGARAGQVLKMILRQGAFQMGMRLLLGLLLAEALSRGLSSMIFGVEPWDGSVFLAIAGVTLPTGVAASIIPAQRATRVDPVRALRPE
jgi:hypothetical protein